MKVFKFESSPFRFVFLSLLVFSFAVVTTYIIPYQFSKTIKATQATVTYSALEQKGRSLYIREGCLWCHSQMVRDIEANEITIFRRGDIGNFTDPSLYLKQNPLVIGQHRRGPDLSHDWERWPSEFWQTRHLKNPQDFNPGTWMPPFSYLPDEDIKALVAYIKTLK